MRWEETFPQILSMSAADDGLYLNIWRKLELISVDVTRAESSGRSRWWLYPPAKKMAGCTAMASSRCSSPTSDGKDRAHHSGRGRSRHDSRRCRDLLLFGTIDGALHAARSTSRGGAAAARADQATASGVSDYTHTAMDVNGSCDARCSVAWNLGSDAIVVNAGYCLICANSTALLLIRAFEAAGPAPFHRARRGSTQYRTTRRTARDEATRVVENPARVTRAARRRRTAYPR